MGQVTLQPDLEPEMLAGLGHSLDNRGREAYIA